MWTQGEAGFFLFGPRLGLYVSWAHWQRSDVSRQWHTCRDLDEGQNPTITNLFSMDTPIEIRVMSLTRVGYFLFLCSFRIFPFVDFLCQVMSVAACTDQCNIGYTRLCLPDVNHQCVSVQKPGKSLDIWRNLPRHLLTFSSQLGGNSSESHSLERI